MLRRQARAGRRGRRASAGALVFIVAVVLGGALLPGRGLAANRAGTPTTSAWTPLPEAALEAIHGIRVTQIAVTAGGGLVDLRFTVVDPEKARPLLAGHALLPRLVVEGSGVELQAPKHGAMRGIRIQKDAASFLLFPNTRNAVRPGTRVAVAFGDVQVEPLVAK